MTATIRIDSTGKPQISEWTDWEPTPELRFVTGPIIAVGPFPGSPPRLQQRLVRLGLGTAGHVAAKEFSWRDVPTVSDE